MRKYLTTALSLLTICLAAFALRCLVMTEVFDAGKTYFFGPDAYYHLRRIQLTIAHYPWVPQFDYYVNFPSGSPINWPFGFDFILATIALLAGKGHPDVSLTEAVCAWTIPIIGTLTVGLLYFIARTILSRPKALLASLLLALSGPHILVSRIGHVDHHVMEAVFPALAFLFYLRSLAMQGSASAARRSLILSGVFLGLSLSIWSGCIMYIGILMAFLFLQLGIDLHRGQYNPVFAKGGKIVLLVTTLVLLPVCYTSPWTRKGEILYVALSWFHFLIPLYGLVAFSILAYIAPRILSHQHRTGLYICVVSLFFLTVLGLTCSISPSALQTLKDAFDFLTRKEIHIHSVAESTPLFSARPEVLRILFGGLIWILPLLALYGILGPLLGGLKNPLENFFSLWFLAALGFAALQIRFTPALSIVLSILLVRFMSHTVELLSRIGQKRHNPLPYRMAGLSLAGIILLQVITTALAQPYQRGLPQLLETFYRIREITPESDNYWEPGRRPQYGILAHWPFGHYLNYISHRPNVANPFGQAEWYLQGVLKSYHFYLSEDEDTAVALCRSLSSPYVLASQISRYIATVSTYLPAVRSDLSLEKDPDHCLRYLKNNYTRLLNNQMVLQDGLGSPATTSQPGSPPLTRFRLIYESPIQETDKVTGQTMSLHKLYQLVQGATVTGRARPGEKVILELPVITNLKRRLLYRQEVLSGDDGTFVMRVPYSTDNASLPCHAVGPCRITYKDHSLILVITESDVCTGSRVTVNNKESPVR